MTELTSIKDMLSYTSTDPNFHEITIPGGSKVTLTVPRDGNNNPYINQVVTLGNGYANLGGICNQIEATGLIMPDRSFNNTVKLMNSLTPGW